MWGTKRISDSQKEILEEIAEQRGFDTQISRNENVVFDGESIFSAPKTRNYEETTFDHFVDKLKSNKE